MIGKQTVTINGTVYDTHTGLPISGQAAAMSVAPPHTPSQPSHAVHTLMQKSQTLNRRVVQKHKLAPSTPAAPPVAKSSMIAKFAPQSAATPPPAARVISDFGPTTHPIVAKAQHHLAAASSHDPMPAATPKPSQIIKQEAISEALAQAPTRRTTAKTKKAPKKMRRLASIGSITLALLLLGGYFTYLNMPSLSVRVAAAQAGVNASYPEYRPDGYSLSGAVAYSQGQVSMKFAYNGNGQQTFTLNQSKSNWDSSAVNNYVGEKSGGSYIPYTEHGLTIYIYGSNAAWVNGGVLYTLTGNAPLSGDQIRHIATSM